MRGVSSLLVIEEFLVYLWKIESLLAAPTVCVGPLIIHRYFLPHHASASAAVAILVHDEPRAVRVLPLLQWRYSSSDLEE